MKSERRDVEICSTPKTTREIPEQTPYEEIVLKVTERKVGLTEVVK